MEIVKHSAVLSRAGRDAGRYFAVLDVADGYATIADGDLRKLDKPKHKKIIHLGATKHQFAQEELVSDNALSAAIKARFGGSTPSKEA